MSEHVGPRPGEIADRESRSRRFRRHRHWTCRTRAWFVDGWL